MQQHCRVSVRVTQELVRITRAACEGALRSPNERSDDLKKVCRSLIEIFEQMSMDKHPSQAGAAGVCVVVDRRCGTLGSGSPGDTVSMSCGHTRTGWRCEGPSVQRDLPWVSKVENNW